MDAALKAVQTRGETTQDHCIAWCDYSGPINDKLVGLTILPPGSLARDRSQVGALKAEGGMIGCASNPCRYAIRVTRWWTVPLSMNEALSWLHTHPPAGLYLNGNSATGKHYVSWTYQDRPAPSYTVAELTVAVAKDGANRSVIRADGAVLWVPPRSAAEHVPERIDQVTLVGYEGDTVTRRRTVHGDAARQLASLLNYLGRNNMGSSSCPFPDEI